MTAKPEQLTFGDKPKRIRGRARRGLDTTIAAMRSTHLLEPIDEAVLALNRVAADELDAALLDTNESRYTRGVLIARYRDVLSDLLGRGNADDAGAQLAADLFAAMDNDPAG